MTMRPYQPAMVKTRRAKLLPCDFSMCWGSLQLALDRVTDVVLVEWRSGALVRSDRRCLRKEKRSWLRQQAAPTVIGQNSRSRPLRAGDHVIEVAASAVSDRWGGGLTIYVRYGLRCAAENRKIGV